MIRNKYIRFALIAVVILLLLLLLLTVLIRLPSIQNYAQQKVLQSLSTKYDADWQIDNLNISFLDQIEAEGVLLKDQSSDTLLAVDQITVNIGLFSLLGKKISIDDINIENAHINLYELPNGEMNYNFILPDPDENAINDKGNASTTSNSWSFDINKISLDQVELHYKTKDLEVKTIQESLNVDFNEIDFTQKVVALDKVKSQNTYTFLSINDKNDDSSSSILPYLGWTVNIDDLNLYQKLIEINDEQNTRISELNLVAQDLDYQADSLIVDIKQLNGNYNDQIDLKEGSAQLAIHQDKVDVKNVVARTKADQVLADQLSIDLGSESYDVKNLTSNLSYKLLKILEPYVPNNLRLLQGEKLQAKTKSFHFDPRVLQFNKMDLQYGTAISLQGSLNLEASHLDFQNPDVVQVNIDLLTADIHQLDSMLSSYTAPDSLQRFQHLTASGIANGNFENLTLDYFSIKIDDSFEATTKGTIRNINQADSLSYDLDFENATFNTSQLPYASLDNIDILALGQTNYIGKLSGDMTIIRLDGNLQSVIGDADTDIVLGFKDGMDSLTYKGDIALSEFDLGTLLKDESLGKITLTTSIDGKGTTLQKGNIKLKGDVNDFEYRGYTYNIIQIDAYLQEGQIEGVISIDDPNVQLQYDGTLSLGEKISTFDFSIQIDTINMQNLNLHKEEISMSGDLKSQLSLPLSSREQQQALIQNLHLSSPTDHFHEDSISISAISKADSTYLSIDSDLMQLHMDGIYQLTDLPASINELANSYIDMDTIIEHTDITSSNIHLYGQVHTLMPINVLLVDHLLQSKLMNIDVKVDFEQSSLVGEIEVDSFFYDHFFSEQLLLNATTADNVIDINGEGNMNTFSGTPIKKLKLTNKINNNRIESKLSTLDKSDNRTLELSAQSQYKEGAILIEIQDSVILNNKNWNVLSDNLITIENNCFTVSNFELSDGLESIKVNSNSKGKEELSVLFENFEIEEYTDLVLKNGSSASGTINGEFDIRGLCSTPYFIANLAVKDIVYDSLSIGTLSISGDSEPENSLIKTDLSLIGPSNNVTGSAKYNTATRDIDMHLLVDSLQLLVLDPFLHDIIKNSQGHLSGEVKLSGTTEEPNISGQAKLHNTVTTIVANNTQYSFHDHVINFDDTTIDIGDLEINDKEGNTANLTGKIYHKNLKDMIVDLKIDTDKFLFLNTTTQENPVFFGRVFLDAQGIITGPVSLLQVDVTAKSLSGTEITISPYSAEAYLEEDFITYGKPQDFGDLTDEYLLQLAQQYPFDVTLLLDVTEDCKLTIVVDPINGDQVEGFGSGDIKVKLNPDGEQEFYGRYTVKKGTYVFSYGDFVSKEFQINEGGSVLFNGDLLDAVINIDAVYNVYTTTYELVKDEVALDASDFNNSQSRTNVEVFLTLAGPLSRTEILLDIKIPEQESSSLISPVDRRLAEIRDNPNELNNQVFGLLIFNSFIISQNSSFGIGTLGSNLALSSISELISNQLNNFAQNYIKGVDVNINVNSYDSKYVNDGAGGNVTEVGLQVSKQLFNDRLSISATGNVDLEENDQEGYSTVVGDFVLEYKLTEDGRYRLRVFSKTDYDRLLNENNNKNGVSLYFKKSFGSKKNKTD